MKAGWEVLAKHADLGQTALCGEPVVGSILVNSCGHLPCRPVLRMYLLFSVGTNWEAEIANWVCKCFDRWNLGEKYLLSKVSMRKALHLPSCLGRGHIQLHWAPAACTQQGEQTGELTDPCAAIGMSSGPDPIDVLGWLTECCHAWRAAGMPVDGWRVSWELRRSSGSAVWVRPWWVSAEDCCGRWKWVKPYSDRSGSLAGTGTSLFSWGVSATL